MLPLTVMSYCPVCGYIMNTGSVARRCLNFYSVSIAALIDMWSGKSLSRSGREREEGREFSSALATNRPAPRCFLVFPCPAVETKTSAPPGNIRAVYLPRQVSLCRESHISFALFPSLLSGNVEGWNFSFCHRGRIWNFVFISPAFSRWKWRELNILK